MGYCYDENGRLVCDYCGATGNTTRIRCPWNYCQPTAACPECCKKHKERHKSTHRARGCEKFSIAFDKERAEKSEMLREGKYLLSSALGVGDHTVHVLFMNIHGDIRGYYMSSETYDARHNCETQNLTPEWFKNVEGAQVVEAPPEFDNGATLLKT